MKGAAQLPHHAQHMWVHLLDVNDLSTNGQPMDNPSLDLRKDVLEHHGAKAAQVWKFTVGYISPPIPVMIIHDIPITMVLQTQL